MSFLIWMQSNLRSIVGDAIFSTVANSMAYYALALVVAAALVLYKPTRVLGATAFLGIGITIILGDVLLNNIINRPRPEAVYPFIHSIVQTGNASFPSGHVAGLFSVAAAIFFYNRRWSIPVFVCGLIMAFAVMYCFANFPTDVVAGMVIGVISGSLAYILVDEITDRYADLLMGPKA